MRPLNTDHVLVANSKDPFFATGTISGFAFATGMISDSAFATGMISGFAFATAMIFGSEDVDIGTADAIRDQE